jgi:hypothetical protein
MHENLQLPSSPGSSDLFGHYSNNVYRKNDRRPYSYTTNPKSRAIFRNQSADRAGFVAFTYSIGVQWCVVATQHRCSW